MDKNYQPQEHEKGIYKQWEDSGLFQPDLDKLKAGKKPYTIIMPPPNANGSLHAGHAVGYTLEDIIIRYHRLQGRPTLWQPGTDHAGIETQFVYEKKLKEQGLSRYDLGRDEFYKQVEDFTRNAQGTILDQFRSMGFSADWSRLKFTLDQDIIDIVYDTFKRMHDDGHVYRGKRIVNWCPNCQAAFADIEVEREDRVEPFYTFKYGPFEIATARPETKFGDKYVVMHPDDERYKDYSHGDTFEAEWINGPVTATVIKDDAIDMEFGTGVMTITPWHDATDFDIAERHDLDKQQIIDEEGKLLAVAQEFAGMPIAEARGLIVEKLDKKGLLVKTEEREHAVALHDRCKLLIEPQISLQWFVRMAELNQPVLKAFNEDLTVFPKRFTKIATNWIENEHDWCISRGTWWGIRIPIYYRLDSAKSDSGAEGPAGAQSADFSSLDETTASPRSDKTDISHASDASAPGSDSSEASHDQNDYIVSWDEQEAIDKYGAGNYVAETDTFDTWYSSSQWPYATLRDTMGDRFDDFYPTTLMGTAKEILHKWVTRMVMFSLYREGRLPFENIYLWGLVTDEHGAKMSKSKGNVVDPLELTDKYGTDALRLTGALLNTPGNDSPLGESKVVPQRNFCNKLWNVSRFILNQEVASSKNQVSSDGAAGAVIPDPDLESRAVEVEPRSAADHWIVSRLAERKAAIEAKVEGYRLNEAAYELYHFVWDDLADWYIEASKVAPNPGLAREVLRQTLIIAHPFIPFITETIWDQLDQDGMVAASDWPESPEFDPEHAKAFEAAKAITERLRSAAKQLSTESKSIVTPTDIGETADIIKKLTGFDVVDQGEGIVLAADNGLTFTVVATDDEAAAYQDELDKQRADIERQIKQLEGRLSNDAYVKNAPTELVQQTKDQLATLQSQLG